MKIVPKNQFSGKNYFYTIAPRAAVSTVNFTTTRAGLSGQLLAAALQHDKPELELRKSELLKKEEEHKMQIGRLEDFLLEQLARDQLYKDRSSRKMRLSQ